MPPKLCATLKIAYVEVQEHGLEFCVPFHSEFLL